VVAAALEIIVAAGAIGCPHLLMLSGIGPEAHLRAHGIDVTADLPEVARTSRTIRSPASSPAPAGP
jgi:choline dehydrogenase